MFCFLILYFPNHKIITVSNGSFRKTTSLILSIISLSSIQSDSSILHLILFIYSLFKSQTTNITASSQITHYSISLFLSNTHLSIHHLPHFLPFLFQTGVSSTPFSSFFKSIHASSRLSFKYILLFLSFFIYRSKYKT